MILKVDTNHEPCISEEVLEGVKLNWISIPFIPSDVFTNESDVTERAAKDFQEFQDQYAADHTMYDPSALMNQVPFVNVLITPFGMPMGAELLFPSFPPHFKLQPWLHDHARHVLQ